MVQEEKEESENKICDLKIVPLAGVDINDAAARLQSRDVLDDNIFEILPRFSITGGESNKDWHCQYERRRNEVLTVTGAGDVTGILVGCELLVFERDKDEPLKQLHFSACVDFVVWRRSILLIGLSSSEIILVDPSTFAFSFTWQAIANVEGKKPFFVDAFIHSNPDRSKIDVIVVSKKGLVCIFREIALSDGTMDATHDQNVSLDLDLGSIKDISKHTLSISSEIVCVCSPTRNSLIAVEETGDFVVVDLVSNTQTFVVSNLSYDIHPQLTKKCIVPKKIAEFEGNLFILFSNGVLEIFTDVNPYTSNPLPHAMHGSSVYDFTLVKNSNEGTVKLWVLYSTGSSSGTNNYVGIFGGPTFTSEFNFQLAQFNKTDESSFFKFPKNINPFEEPSSIIEMGPNNIILYHILETSTDVTLQKLLSRGKYLEAEDLARCYNKDLDVVRKAEARDKLSKVVASCTNISEGKLSVDLLWGELLAVLKKITDAEFVCNFCVQAQLHRVDWVKEILALGKSRISECSATMSGNTLLLTLKKFFTFELVYPSGTINEWNTFISKDNNMFLQSMKFLHTGNFAKCERVWRRHFNEFIPEISLKEFLPFFNVLFDHQLKSVESVSLLKTILPYSVEKVSRSAISEAQASSESTGSWEHDALIAIILRQVNTLESRIDWPVNALQFVKVLSSVIKNEIKHLEESRTEHDATLLRIKKQIVQQISHQLDHLEQILDELAELKRNHSIRIMFHDYTNNDIPEVVNKLLFKLLSQEEVEGFVSKYLKPYAERKHLNMDSLFAEHIKSVVQYIHYYIQAINIPHEERIICLVNLISSMKIKLECALLISGEWPVPWTPGIAGMVERILATPRATLNRDCANIYDQIHVMQKQVPFRCVLNKYKLNSSKLCTKRAYVTMALLRILKSKKPGFHDDCKEILKHIPSRTLIDENRLEYIEFILRLYNEDIPVDETMPNEMQQNRNLRKAIVRRVFVELQNMEKNEVYDTNANEDVDRVISIYKYLAAESNDPRDGTLGKLKHFLPATPLDIIYSCEFPYACLTSLLEGTDTHAYVQKPAKLLNDCKRLSQITQTYLPDILLFAGAYFTTTEGLHAIALLWYIIEQVVKSPLNPGINNTPNNQGTLQVASFQIAKVLMVSCPDSSLQQMYSLQEFLCRLSGSFENSCIDIGQLLSFFRIFLSLKEQEIPLEYDFLEVYKYLFSEGRVHWEVVKDKLKLIGETLVKFGEMDLCLAIFKSVKRHLLSLISTLHDDAGATKSCTHILISFESVRIDLWKRLPTIVDDDANSQMRKLVRDLNEAGIRVNVYALKIRNKVKLLERLLSLQIFILAAELAVTFSYYDNHEIWARILGGLVTNGNVDDLKRVLENVSRVPQLWMLPEFAVGWKKVSEVDNSFLDLCPIPLE